MRLPLPGIPTGVDEALWRAPAEAEPLRFVRHDLLTRDCPAAFACVKDDSEERIAAIAIDWKPRPVSDRAMLCIRFQQVASNHADLTFAIRFTFAATGAGARPSLVAVHAGYSGGYLRLHGQYPSIVQYVDQAEGRFCQAVLVREPMTLERLTLYPAIGYQQPDPKATGELRLDDVRFYEANR